MNKKETKPSNVGVQKWFEENIREEAKKYKNRSQFNIGSNGAYVAADKLDILKDIFPKTFGGKRPKLKWDTFEKCQVEALKYDGRTEFKEKAHGAYLGASNGGWLDKLFPKSLKFQWTKESCIAEASKYESSGKFKKGAKGAYNYASKNKFLKDLKF